MRHSYMCRSWTWGCSGK